MLAWLSICSNRLDITGQTEDPDSPTSSEYRESESRRIAVTILIAREDIY
jgi:hypothetical protein